MNNSPPLFYEEIIPSPSGNIDVKIFIDRDTLKIHILALQYGRSYSDYGSKLIEKIKTISPCKKAYVICYVNSSDEIPSIKQTIDSYIAQIQI